MELAELIRSFCNDCGCKCYENYSGRGMFGKTCIGIVTDANMFEVILGLSDYLHECGVDNVREELGRVCHDNLGLDMVVYFPSVTCGKS